MNCKTLHFAMPSSICFYARQIQIQPPGSLRMVMNHSREGEHVEMHDLQNRANPPRRHHSNVTLQRANRVAVIRDVPAEVCGNCGEYYLSEPAAKRVYADGGDTARRHVEVGIQQHAARSLEFVKIISASR